MKDKIRIVIADDNPHMRQTLQDILVEKKYLVGVVKDGYELLGYLKEQSPHLVILDLMMPEKDGTEILFALKRFSPNIKIIIYTSFKKYENSIYARIADRFLVKGDSPEKLLEVIKELVHSK